MDKIEDAIQTVHKLDHQPGEHLFQNVHPLAKVLITICYIVLLTSIEPYDLTTTLSMSVYLILISMIQNISIKDIIKRFKVIFLLLIAVGAANPILDQTVVSYIGILPVTTGMISMLTLILKGFFAVISSLILISSTGIEEICYSLKLLHIPNMIIMTIMLIYRYIVLFLKEMQRIWISYQMRAPRQKGINYKAWGSMIGSLMIRSIDKAEIVYESMELRGYQPENFFLEDRKFDRYSLLYFLLGLAVILIFRYLSIFE
ncbi:MAG: energy-coupling factor transporter transmembrane component T, partial [Lachnospiraceae bacterium]|nr:energy-coupling factor transporter transmembrane component T [Lachnospiraceae bacterium]